MIQFGTIKFCRTFKNYFGLFVWIEKKFKKGYYNSRVSLHEARLKNKPTAGINIELDIQFFKNKCLVSKIQK